MREHFTAVKLEAKTKHNDCCWVIMCFQRSVAKYRAKLPKTPVRSLAFSGC
jgi:hypothetical protein